MTPPAIAPTFVPLLGGLAVVRLVDAADALPELVTFVEIVPFTPVVLASTGVVELFTTAESKSSAAPVPCVPPPRFEITTW